MLVLPRGVYVCVCMCLFVYMGGGRCVVALIAEKYTINQYIHIHIHMHTYTHIHACTHTHRIVIMSYNTSLQYFFKPLSSLRDREGERMGRYIEGGERM